jgi:hypothetical protein
MEELTVSNAADADVDAPLPISPHAARGQNSQPNSGRRNALHKIRIGDTLPTPRQLFILENLPSIMSKNKEHFQLLVRQGEQPKEGVFYLKYMAKEYGLRHSAGKDALVGRLTSYFFYKDHLFEDKFRPFIDMVAWNKAQALTTEEMNLAKNLKSQHYDSSSDGDDDPSDQERSPLTKDFRPGFLSIAWQAKTLGVLPNTDVFYFCGIPYYREHVLNELDALDTSVISKEAAIPLRRTPACVLRLIQILFFREDFYDRLMSGENGADFWKDVHKAYTNRYLHVGPPLVDHPLFAEFDLQQVNSPWVTPDKLKDWFTSARRAFQRQSYEGNLETGFDEFVESCNGALDVIYLAGSAQKKGGSLTLDFLKAPIPEDASDKVRDGPVIILHPSLTSCAPPRERKRTKELASDSNATAAATGTVASKPAEADDGATKHQLESLLEELNATASNERENYYKERTKRIKIENMFATKREEIRLLGQKAETQAQISEAVLKCYESAKLMEQAGAKESAEKLRENAEKLLNDKLLS